MTRLLVVALLAALSAFGADVAGKWKAVYESRNGPREVIFTFQVSDGKLTGTVVSPQGNAPITAATLDGDKISFTVETDQVKAAFTGTVAGDEMKLTATAGERTYDLPAKRITEPRP